MNKILYEASYIGNARGFANNVMVVSMLIFFFIMLSYAAKKNKKKKNENSTNTGKEYFIYMAHYVWYSFFAVIFGIAALTTVMGLLLGYHQVILGYKRGEYRKVEGIVEDYMDQKDGCTFTVDGIEFEINTASLTWGYLYWHGKNVITGDGQHLKIRYIPRSNSIVYIEEIVET